MVRRTDSREGILDAAEAVVAQAGAAHLTLDAVAAKAGMSKGGLLYHFPSKELLLQGMLARLLERADQDRAKVQQGLEQTPSAALQAHVLAGLQQHPDREQVAAALFAAGANDPRLLAPVRAWQRCLFEEMVKPTRHPGRAAVIMLAMDGLWLNELLRTSPMTQLERTQVMEELVALAQSVG